MWVSPICYQAFPSCIWVVVKKVENTENIEDLSIILFLEAEKKVLILCKTDYTANRLEVQLF